MKKIYLFILMLLTMQGMYAQNNCASAIPIASIPFSSGTLTTCGTVDDYAVGAYYTGNYGAGEDYVFSLNITSAPVSYNVTLGGAAVWKIASVHSACPPLSSNAIGGVTTSSGTTGTSQITFSTNGTYYIIVDTWPSPTCGGFTLDIAAPAPMAYVSSTTTQSSTAAVTGGTLNQQIIRVQVVTNGQISPLNLTQLDLNTNGSTNPANDIAAAKVYYTGSSTTFATTTQFGSTVNNPNGAYSVVGSQVLLGGTANTNNYFWIVYDLACGATGANLVDAECTGITVGTPQVPTVTAPAGTRTITAATNTIATTQPSTAVVIAGTANNQILRAQVTSCAGATVTALDLTTTGSTNPTTDITSANVYFTTTTTFATTTPFGTTYANPNGAFVVTGSQVLASGTGYFWIVYDVPASATTTNVLDASIASATVNGLPVIPTTQNPTGTRTIVAPPSNDICSGAIVIPTAGPFPYLTGATGIDYATNTNDPSNSCQANSNKGIWYSFTPNVTGSFIISSCQSAAPLSTVSDNVIGIFTSAAGCAGPFTQVACDDDACTSLANQAVSTADLNAGTTYYIVVYGYNTNVGNVQLHITAPPPQFITATSGDWNIAATWLGGRVPDCNDNVVIDNGHTVTATTVGNVSKTVTVRTTGTLTISAGELTVGCTAKNNSLINNGVLSLAAGTLRINGNFLTKPGSTFNQSGGDIIVDGNDGAVAATSVAAGIPIVNFQSTALNSINLTGGVFTIVDPHASTTSTETVMVDGSVIGPLNATPAHTFRFGDGISTDAGGSTTFGFRGNWWFNESGLPIGNMIIEGPTGTNRFVSSTYQLAILKNLTVNSGGELRTANLYIGGDVIANSGGFITTTGTSTIPTVLLANVSYSTITSGNFAISDATDAQLVGGVGTFRNSATAPTANIRNLTVQNISSAGVTLSAPLTIGFSFVPAKGLVNTTNTNLLTVGTSGTSKGTIFQGLGWVAGPLKKWIGSAAGSDTLTVGTTTSYKPVVMNFTTAPTTAGTVMATFSSTPPNFPNAAPLVEGALIINKASTQGSWFVESGDGLTGGVYTGTFTGNGATDVLDYTKTVLIKRPSSGGDWTLDGTHVTTTGSNTAPVLSRTGMTNFAAEFAIGGEVLVALPINIEYFTGTKQSGQNRLDWKINCYNSPTVTMVLERSANGRNFSDLITLTETAVRCQSPFNQNDLNPLPGINYYRLKTTDIDGKVGYSNVVALLNQTKGFELVSLAPNPVVDKAVLSVTSAEKSIMEIVVTDISGKQISKQRVSLIAGNNQIQLSLKNVAAGSYQVSGLTENGEVKTLRFVKQ